ncbi:MAG: iron-containing alcohol dehydrogenase [bacterium]
MDLTEVIEIRVPRTLIGVGALNGIGDLVRSLGARKLLIVTDQGLVEAGIIASVRAALGSGGLKAEVFDQCGPEAPVSTVEALSRMASEGGYDLLIGVGGGSVMDATKTAGLLAANPDIGIQDLIDGGSPAKSLSRILIPTTAGTGSEWSTVAVFTTDTSDDRNYAYITGGNLPDAVIIDPELTRDLPARITADGGIDALTHAIEAYTSSRANLVTDMYASTAIKLVTTSLRPAYAKGSVRLEDRYRLSIAAAVAMLAGSVGGVGIAHFMNHALHHKKVHLSHGAKVGLLLPYVMEYNLISGPDKFAEVARLMGENTRGLSTMDAALKSVAAVRRLLSDLGVPQRLSEVGITEADIPGFVDELMTFQAVPMAFMNPREVGPKEAAEIFLKAL